MAKTICTKCSQVFTRNGLRRHKAGCNGPNKDVECPECGELFKTEKGVKEHQENDHSMQQVKSRVVCKHWRRGNCFKGDLCGYAHVGRQSISDSKTTQETSTKVPACKNGPTCEWLRKSTCSYFHPRVGVQKPWVRKDRNQVHRLEGARPAGGQGGSQGGRQEAPRQAGGKGGRQETGPRNRVQGHQIRQRTVQPDREKCKFDGRCERIPNCPFIHSLEDFPIFQGRRNPVAGRHQNQKKK